MKLESQGQPCPGKGTRGRRPHSPGPGPSLVPPMQGTVPRGSRGPHREGGRERVRHPQHPGWPLHGYEAYNSTSQQHHQDTTGRLTARLASPELGHRLWPPAPGPDPFWTHRGPRQPHQHTVWGSPPPPGCWSGLLTGGRQMHSGLHPGRRPAPPETSRESGVSFFFRMISWVGYFP